MAFEFRTAVNKYLNKYIYHTYISYIYIIHTYHTYIIHIIQIYILIFYNSFLPYIPLFYNCHLVLETIVDI